MTVTTDNHLTEAEWWDKYGDVNEDIWHYNDYLNEIVRGDYLREMEDFLYNADGKLLDFGCGGGWVSLPLAQRGMQVVGIDVSGEQVARAQQKAHHLGLSNAHYICGDVSMVEAVGPVDSIVVHSVLHHLEDEQKRTILTAINRALRPGGRVYLYEPMAIDPQRIWYGNLFDKSMIVFFRLLQQAALMFHWYTPELEMLHRAKWTMESPDEAPIPYQQMMTFIPDNFHLKASTYWQAYSVKYANFCMSLRPQWLHRLQGFTPLFYNLDRLVLSSDLRQAVKVWPMASFLLQKRGAV